MAVLSEISRLAPIRIKMVLQYLKMEENLYCFKLSRVIVAQDHVGDSVDVSPFGPLVKVVREGFTRKTEIDSFKRGTNSLRKLDLVLVDKYGFRYQEPALDIITACSCPASDFLPNVVRFVTKQVGNGWEETALDRMGEPLQGMFDVQV